MPLISFEINLILTWPQTCVITGAGAVAGTFAIIDTKRYVPVVIFSTQDNAELPQQLKSGFKRTINCNTYESKVALQALYPYLG